MAKQSLVWTALPNGYTADGSALRVSVMVSPRLDPQASPGVTATLASFLPDWGDWPATLQNATFDVTFNGSTIRIVNDGSTGADRVDDTLGRADSAVWRALFSNALPVHPFAYRDHSSTRLLSYDTVRLAEQVEHLYRDMAARADADLPLVSEFIDRDAWSAVLKAVDVIDRASVDPNTGLRNPRAELDRGVAPTRSADLSSLLARFQLFHTPLAAWTVHDKPRRDDDRISARYRQYPKQPPKLPPDLAKELDFHKIVAAMGSYPTLLRRLGLVVDLLVSPTALPRAADAGLSVSVTMVNPLAVPKTVDASPVTRTRLTAQHFDCVSSPTATLRVTERLLDLDPATFTLLPFDVDGAGLKLMNFARSMFARTPEARRVDPVSRREDRTGAPSLRGDGLMLVHRNRASILHNRFVANRASNTQIETAFAGGATAPTLFAEDLVRGYRVDMWDSSTGKWQSVCRRSARYEVGAAPAIDALPEEESIVRLGATQALDPASAPDVMSVHEAMVSWAGWSLAAPLPGRAIRTDDSFDPTAVRSEPEPVPGVPFSSRFRVVPGSLPRLRFGRAYWMRLRAVDLAGNSLPWQLTDFGHERPLLHARPYLRYEPVAPPVVALWSEGGAIAAPGEGESIATMTIRSFNDREEDNAVASTDAALRALAPPQVSVREAELHGVLDDAGKVDASLYGLLAHAKDIDPKQPEAAIRKVSVGVKTSTASSPVPHDFAVYEAEKALTYLPDPLAKEIAIRVFSHPNIADTEVLTMPLYPDGATWPNARPFAVEVFDDPTASPSVDVAGRRLRIPLPKGVRATVRLSVKLSPDSLALMGVYAWLPDAERLRQRQRALDGQHWMLTPFTDVDVVHAVQRPLLSPDISVVAIQTRTAGQTSARPTLVAKCSIKSVDRLDVRAEWHEPQDVVELPASEQAPIDVARQDLAFHVKVTDPSTYADAAAGARGGGNPDHAIVGPDLIAIGAAPRRPAKAHEFHDTRYRRIEYWLEATSKFREFLPHALLTHEVDGARKVTDEHVTVTGRRAVTWIPSSAQPPAPRVLYVVPTFGWSRATEADGSVSSHRRGGGLRVYLDRGWNASGYGEMLAVVLPPDGFDGNPDTTPSAQPYKKYVTQWGNDPVWDSAFVKGVAPTRANFPQARLGPDPTGAWLPLGAPITEADQRPGAFDVKSLRPAGLAGAGPVSVAPHDVYFDAERRLWYADILIAAGASYFPFVRLALARYQPISEGGAHLSNVVLADVMALTADRWLTVTPSEDGRERRVSVYGATYDESSGHREASGAPSMSIFDPLTGTTRTRVPASVAKSTVVEVWLEQLDERLGPDFGWARVADASVVKSEPGLLAGAGFAQAPSQAPGPIAAQPAVDDASALGRFAALRIDLADALRLLRPLWNGNIAVPEGAGHRQRIVVAEFEEYIIDDDQPYDRIPTRKGRRMVFVEHVEV